MIRLRTAAIGALLLSLMLNACSGGAGGMLPAAQNPANMQSLSGGTTPQSTGRLPISVNCPSIAASGAARISIHLPSVHRMGDRPAEPVGAGTTALPTRQGCGNGIARPHIDGTCAASNSCQNKDCPAGGSGGHDACNPPGMGAPPGWNNCVIGCNPTNPGSPIGIPGGPPCRPISSCIAMLAPSSGEHCHDSISALGENVPVSTSDAAHTVVDMFTVAATTTPIGGSAESGPMGYIYVDENGQWYLGESPSYTGNAFEVLAGSIPVIGRLVAGVKTYGKNFDAPITPSQVQALKQGGNLGQAINVVPCFTKPLPS